MTGVGSRHDRHVASSGMFFFCHYLYFTKIYSIANDNKIMLGRILNQLFRRDLCQLCWFIFCNTYTITRHLHNIVVVLYI